jgi:hypothetical protein
MVGGVGRGTVCPNPLALAVRTGIEFGVRSKDDLPVPQVL